LIIPPSNVLIIYSLASGGVSIAALFVAGYLPGILLGISLMICAAYFIKKKKLPEGERVSLAYLGRSFWRAIPSMLLLVLVIGGIVAGVFTATEASAIAVVYTLLLSLAYRELKWSEFTGILVRSSETTAVVLLLIGTSMSMSWVMSAEDIPQMISEFMLTLSDNKWVILIVINLILLFVGMFMDITPAVLIFTPIFLPVVTNVGVDPIHFGIMMVVNLCIGLCTPPVGSLLFVGVSIAKISLTQVLRPLLPFFMAMVIALVLIMIFPELSLLLPRLFGLM